MKCHVKIGIKTYRLDYQRHNSDVKLRKTYCTLAQHSFDTDHLMASNIITVAFPECQKHKGEMIQS